MPHDRPPNQGGDVPTPQKNIICWEQDRVSGRAQPNAPSPPRTVVDGYKCQYSDENSIINIADLKKGNWPKLTQISFSKNMLTKVKIK